MSTPVSTPVSTQRVCASAVAMSTLSLLKKRKAKRRVHAACMPSVSHMGTRVDAAWIPRECRMDAAWPGAKARAHTAAAQSTQHAYSACSGRAGVGPSGYSVVP